MERKKGPTGPALTPFPLCSHQGQKSRRAAFCFKLAYCSPLALTPFPLRSHQGQKSRRAVFRFKLAYCSPLAVKSGQLFAAVIQMADSKEPPVSSQLSSARRQPINAYVLI
jgi:hypothetical protein